MSSTATENVIRDWTDEQLINASKLHHEDFIPWQFLIILDELVHRGVDTAQFPYRLEHIIPQLSDQELYDVEEDEQTFSMITLHFAASEKLSRKYKPLQWYYGKGNRQVGPLDRMKLYDHGRNGFIGATDYVWREGMEDWVPASSIQGLVVNAGAKKETFAESFGFEQTQNQQTRQTQNTQTQEPQRPKPQQPVHQSVKKVPGGLTFAGIVQLTTIPFWMVAAVLERFMSALSGSGLKHLIFLMCIYMTGSSVAIGIGLLGAKQWAYKLTAISLGLSVALFLYLTSFSGSSLYWFLFLLFESVVLTITLVNAKHFTE